MGVAVGELQTIKQWLEWEVPQTIKQSISRQLCESQLCELQQVFVYAHFVYHPDSLP